VSEVQQKEQSEQKPDAASVDKENEAQKKPVTQKHKKHRSHNTGNGIWFLLIGLLIVAAGWGAYDYLDKYKQQIQRLNAEQNKLQQQTNSLREEFDSKWDILKKQQDDLTDHINTLREKNLYLRKDWLLLEAEYLIQLANQRLLFERDINTSIAALDSADMRLRDTGDPGVVKVRQTISEAIQSLKQVPQSDLAGMSLTLSTINKDLEKLPLSTPDPKSREQEIMRDMKESRNVESWKELPAAIWRDLKNLIVIRDHEKPVQPLLSPEERFFLMENLRLQIEQARLAMLSGRERVYKERIATAIQWIQQHFDKESPVTKATIETLQQLSIAAIAPELPDISNTYQALQRYRAGEKPVKKVTPPATETEQKPQDQ